jgi:hypothetical protein
VHESMSLYGAIDAPTWTSTTASTHILGEVLGAVTERSRGILLGRTTLRGASRPAILEIGLGRSRWESR